MAKTNIYALSDAMVEAVKGYVSRAQAPVDTRLDALMARIAHLEFKAGALAMSLGQGNPEGLRDLENLMARVKELEARPVGMSYCGVWREGNEYGQGAVVTHQGSAWHCNRKTSARPGSNSDFTLMVKRGADAK